MLGFLLVLLGLIAAALTFFIPDTARHRLLALAVVLVALGVLVGADNLNTLNGVHR